MENFDGTVGRITAAVVRCGLQPDTLLQLIVTPLAPPINQYLPNLRQLTTLDLLQ